MPDEINVIERIIRERYGELGVRVYMLIDGQRNTEQIMRATGIQEPKLMEILDFMEVHRIINMGHPQQRQSYASAQPSSDSLTIMLPSSLASRMQKHTGVNWNEVVSRLINLYIDSLNKARKQLSRKVNRKAARGNIKKDTQKKKTAKKPKGAAKTGKRVNAGKKKR